MRKKDIESMPRRKKVQIELSFILLKCLWGWIGLAQISIFRSQVLGSSVQPSIGMETG